MRQQRIESGRNRLNLQVLADLVEGRRVNRIEDGECRHRVTEATKCIEFSQRTDQFGFVVPVAKGPVRRVNRDSRSIFAIEPSFGLRDRWVRL